MRNYTAEYARLRAKRVMQVTYESTFFRWIDAEWRPKRGASKRLAALAGVSPRTCDGWFSYRHAPNGEALINLMSECQSLADEINKLMESRRGSKTP